MTRNEVRFSGMPASDLGDVRWCKSARSGPQGNCVELAALAGDRIAMRNSRYPSGPALLYPRREIAVLIGALKEGEFDHLLTV